MASEQDMSSWTDLLHSSTKLLEQTAPSAQFPPLQVIALMEANDCESSSGELSDNEIYDNEEEDYYYTSGSISKLQFRKDISKARWNDEMGMAEVMEKKGKMWTTTAVVRNGKTFCSLEETLFLAEIGALLLLDDNDTCLSLKDIYEKVGKEKMGCCWELFEVYRHLKSLGYIVGRHGVPWTMKSTKCKGVDIIGDSVSLQGCAERCEVMEMKSKDACSIIDSFNNLQITEVRPVFDVYLPNSKFKKSCPGDPSFVLCLTSVCPPSKAEIEVLERQCGSIPLKFCHVEHGRISFFSFDRKLGHRGVLTTKKDLVDSLQIFFIFFNVAIIFLFKVY